MQCCNTWGSPVGLDVALPLHILRMIDMCICVVAMTSVVPGIWYHGLKIAIIRSILIDVLLYVCVTCGVMPFLII